MSNELARPEADGLAARIQYARALSEASLLPNAYRKQPANVLLAMEYGEALGLSPIAAIQGVHVIDGKPTASAQLIGALVRKAGHRLRVSVSPDGTAAKATIVRSDDPDFVFESLWTLDRAQAAGLIGKGTWKAYPASMLKARAITEVARDACPEVLSGVAYTAEELGHDDDQVGPIERVSVTVERDDPWASEPAQPAPRGGRRQAPHTPAQRKRLEAVMHEAGVVWDDAMVASVRRVLGGVAEGWDGRLETLDKAQVSLVIESIERFLAEADAQPVVDDDGVIDEDVAGEDYEAQR